MLERATSSEGTSNVILKVACKIEQTREKLSSSKQVEYQNPSRLVHPRSPYHPRHELQKCYYFMYLACTVAIINILASRELTEGSFRRKIRRHVNKPCKQVHPNKESTAWHQLVQTV